MRHYAASVGTPSLRTPLPCGFGTSTSFTGGGKYDPEDIRFHVTYSLFRRSACKSSIVHPSTPGPPWFAFTFRNASTTACLEIANGLSVDFGWFTELLLASRPVASETFPDEPSPSLPPHYRGFITTTRRSASRRGDGTQPSRFLPLRRSLLPSQTSAGTVSTPAFPRS